MTPRRGHPGGEHPDRGAPELEPDERGPWTVVATNGLFSHTLLTYVTRREAEQLLADVRCDRCGCPVSGVPPWESDVVISQFVCRHCRGVESAGDVEGDVEGHVEGHVEGDVECEGDDDGKAAGTEFLLIQEGVDVDVL